jgi:hypothetical protein
MFFLLINVANCLKTETGRAPALTSRIIWNRFMYLGVMFLHRVKSVPSLLALLSSLDERIHQRRF